ncbi:hypothetical protein Sjap_020198 [Stephania japonica]|uniref:Histone H2A n=1 Tax=Stephania japonica TaxID=461633 RepID=A0AAP0I0H4_9MAGN
MAATKFGKGGQGGGYRKKSASKSIKVELQFPVGCITRFLMKGRYTQHVRMGAPIYMAAMLELVRNAARVTRIPGSY